MRTAFAETLHGMAASDPRLWLLSGDLGFSVLEKFRDSYPERYVNVGVAEQNLTGVAAGLSHSGAVVFTYSIANFPTLRCLEQIRNDICYHELPVRVVSVGGGFAYGAAGYTHHGLEDLAIMRSLPGMTVLAPGDPWEAELLTRALAELPGPAYLRLGKAGEPRVHSQRPALAIGQALTVRNGGDLALLSTGAMLFRTLAVAERLAAEHRLEARVLSFHTLKPLDTAAIEAVARAVPWIFTIEEHSVSGGFGSAVAEILAELPAPRAALCRYGVPDRLHERIGSQEYLLEVCGNLEQVILERLARGTPLGPSAQPASRRSLA